ncbi:MAG TPA: hypothetical protein VGL53_01805 [Bryobacteraceae bacterium]|jgi:hypothetical protein
MFKTRLIVKLVFTLSSVALLASFSATANTVTFAGYPFQSLYGTENLVIDSSGNLLVPTTASDFGGASTALPTGTTLLSTTFLDSGVVVGPAAELWAQDFAAVHPYETAIGAFSGYADYYFLYRIDGVGSETFLTTNVARTAGSHTAAIELLSNGTVDFLLDNALVGSVNSSAFGIPVLGNVVLTANGSAAGQQATFTSFAVVTPEPPYGPCLIGAFAALLIVRTRSR